MGARAPRGVARPLRRGVLGASQGTALAATALMWPQGALSVCAVLAVSGLVVEAGLWRVAGAAARSRLD